VPLENDERDFVDVNANHLVPVLGAADLKQLWPQIVRPLGPLLRRHPSV
jgi:hypothetical protein